MKKRIGLIIGELIEYTVGLVEDLRTLARKYDYDIFAFSSYGSFDYGLSQYAEGEKSVYRIPDYSTFSAVIIDDTMLNIEGMPEEVLEYFKNNTECPVIYTKEIHEEFYSILFADRNAMKTITKHFIEEHGVRDICHLAGRWDLQDAHARYEGYKEAMDEAGIEVTDDMFFIGNYWDEKTKEALDFFYSSRGRYPEAIVCANDYMAISVIEELTARGVKVPEEVLVSGYDDLPAASNIDIPLTTFKVDTKAVAERIFEIVLKLDSGQSVERICLVDNKLMLRKSCGCNKVHDKMRVREEIKYAESKFYGLEFVFYMYGSFDLAFEIDEIFLTAVRFFNFTMAKRGFICLAEDAFEITNRPIDSMCDWTDKLVLKRAIDVDSDSLYTVPDIEFDRSDILPECVRSDEPTLFFVYAIHSQNKIYGYLVTVFDDNDRPNRFIQSYTGAIARAIDNYSVRAQYLDVDEMRRAYLCDPLTGIYNRRGLENNMNSLSDWARRNDLYISVASIDLDGLKYINDTYGHMEGDFAIKEFAEILLGSLEEDEICARYGGDEFAAILVSSDKERPKQFVKLLDDNLVIANKLFDKPYIIHASVGVICCNDYPDLSMHLCMKRADDVMYANKKKYKDKLADVNSN